MSELSEPRREKTNILHMRKQRRRISAFVFATLIVQSLYFLNSKFQASSYILWLYSPVCVRPGRKLERWFSHDAALLLSVSAGPSVLRRFNGSLLTGEWDVLAPQKLLLQFH